MKKIAIIYGTDSGNTEVVAEKIAEQLQENSPKLIDVYKATVEDAIDADVLILGTPTTGYGDTHYGWDQFLPQLEKNDLSDKTVALFGLGDQDNYADTFVDAMGIMYQGLAKTNCKFVGFVPASNYTFDGSLALEGDNFVGLPINEDFENELTDGRIADWLSSIKEYLS